MAFLSLSVVISALFKQGKTMNFLVIFLTGMTTGGIFCMAVQGGFLTSVVANQKKPGWLPVGMFLLAKLFIHTVFGFFLGAFGAVISLSLGIRLAFQIFTALFMFATAMNLLNIHPIFRYLAFQPPAFINRLIRNKTKSQALFAPFILGLMTIFIPCGVTQAMEVLTVNSGNAIIGALIMFSFILGTIPIFTVLGVAASQLSKNWRVNFSYAAAFILIAMSAYSLNGVLVAMDSPLSILKNETEKIDSDLIDVQNGLQKVTINIVNNGYLPNYFKVKFGIPVELNLKTDNIYSCASAFVFREFKIFTQLKPTDFQTFTFTPLEKGKFHFSCSMGMYSGTMEVI